MFWGGLSLQHKIRDKPIKTVAAPKERLNIDSKIRRFPIQTWTANNLLCFFMLVNATAQEEYAIRFYFEVKSFWKKNKLHQLTEIYPTNVVSVQAEHL